MRAVLGLALAMSVAALGLAACGSDGGDETRDREHAIQESLGHLRGADVRCKDDACTVIASIRLSNAYTALLTAAPVVEHTVNDPALDGVKTINVTFDDATAGQVFSLRCETGKLGSSVTSQSLKQACHSIFT